ncbi:RraA family protein [Falsiroseomonas selenitidurans]|uniref:Putative 4-hydroxy-4-methyl-2-oxoglutarate aldolase n=1 Tax=Falsiroseomonas selenitidurans TaxID=2716335 RepID=A0ABX1E2Y4_9PROT|nr:RraA family protein [Falsiroseomonas selenitidurans]NKC31532.1 RraA family protein [Falsiroseomonas selenitidurans]
MLTPEIIEGFRSVAIASVADAIDKVAGRRGYLHHKVKNQINQKRMVGPAVTTLHAPTHEFLPPSKALDLIEDSAPGSVIVIGCAGADDDVAFWGGIMTAGAFAMGHAGALLGAGVRDIQEIQRDYDLPVFAPHVSPGTSLGRTATIAANIPVTVGGIVIHPGDLVVGDVDGVCIIRPEHAAAVLQMAREIDAREAEQARLIVETKSLKQGLAKYGRI